MIRFKSIAIFSFFTILLLNSVSFADWSILGDQSQLKGYVITEVGIISEYKPLTFSNKSEDEKIYQFDTTSELDFCFKITKNGTNIENEASLLLIDSKKQLKLAIFKTLIDKIDIYIIDFMQTSCP